MNPMRKNAKKRRAFLALAEGRTSHASITQKPKATLAALSDVIGIEDITSLIFEYMTPICATIDELLKIGAKSKGSRSAAVAVTADATLNTVGYYIIGFRHTVVGDSHWQRFLLDALYKGRNILANVLRQNTEVPLHLLRQIVPQNGDDIEKYVLQRTDFGTCLMTSAGRRDAYTESNWRMTAMWSLFPALCALMIQPPAERQMPLFNVLAPYCLGKAPLNHKVLQQLVLQLLPRDEDQVNFVADLSRFNINHNGSVNVITWLMGVNLGFDWGIADEIRRRLQWVFDFGWNRGFHRNSGVRVTTCKML